MATATLERWRCDNCGAEYISDVGKCGQRIPFCDGTVFLTSRKTLTQVGDELQSAASRMAEAIIGFDHTEGIGYETTMAAHEARSAVEDWTELRRA